MLESLLLAKNGQAFEAYFQTLEIIGLHDVRHTLTNCPGHFILYRLSQIAIISRQTQSTAVSLLG